MEKTFKRSNRHLYVNASWRVHQDWRKQWIEKKKIQGKANFLGRTAFTEVNVRSGSYSGDMVKEQEKGKENGGKWEKVKAERKKKHNAINNEEKRWIYELNPLDCPIDDWFKLRMTTERVFKKRKRKRNGNIWIKEELELQS